MVKRSLTHRYSQLRELEASTDETTKPDRARQSKGTVALLYCNIELRFRDTHCSRHALPPSEGVYCYTRVYRARNPTEKTLGSTASRNLAKVKIAERKLGIPGLVTKPGMLEITQT